jgi:prepilin-type processing-associated H-X9-DG protein
MVKESAMRRKSFSASQRTALTILELLVVVGIVGLLVGLLLPALMSARETARRLQCASNLREIGLAVHQYHDTAHVLPEAWKVASDGISGYGWAVALLPYLEEVNLHKSIDARASVMAHRNETSKNTILTIMLCPSDISEQMFELYAEPPQTHTAQSTLSSPSNANPASSPLVRLPAANYLGVFGTLEADDSFPAPLGDGPIVAGRRVRFADLQRGQSHTLLIGERTTAMVPSTWLGVHFRGEDAACRLVGSAITTPNCTPCDECEFASRHSGGSNFVWADGHVSLVDSDIQPTEYQRLAKRQME